MTGAGTHARIHAVVRRIPKGRLATYGQVAQLAGLPGHARLVGYALSALPVSSGLPWHRVVNAQGQVSRRAERSDETSQLRRLEHEGLRPDARGRFELARHVWKPRPAAWAAEVGR